MQKERVQDELLLLLSNSLTNQEISNILYQVYFQDKDDANLLLEMLLISDHITMQDICTISSKLCNKENFWRLLYELQFPNLYELFGVLEMRDPLEGQMREPRVWEGLYLDTLALTTEPQESSKKHNWQQKQRQQSTLLDYVDILLNDVSTKLLFDTRLLKYPYICLALATQRTVPHLRYYMLAWLSASNSHLVEQIEKFISEEVLCLLYAAAHGATRLMAALLPEMDPDTYPLSGLAFESYDEFNLIYNVDEVERDDYRPYTDAFFQELIILLLDPNKEFYSRYHMITEVFPLALIVAYDRGHNAVVSAILADGRLSRGELLDEAVIRNDRGLYDLLATKEDNEEETFEQRQKRQPVYDDDDINKERR